MERSNPVNVPSNRRNSTSVIRSFDDKKRRMSSSAHTPPSSFKMKAAGSPLNTNSPIALAAAAAVTPDKLARLLLSQGPLAIRHITAHLAMTIPGFADLSLSKQRRLIIAVLDNEDPVSGVRFEKVGWGRWACVKKASSTATSAGAGVGAGTAAAAAQMHHHHQKPRSAAQQRRESITTEVKPPMSPPLDDIELDDVMFQNEPVFDDDDEDDEEDEDGLQQTRQETDDEDWQSIGAASLRRDSPASFGFSNAPYSQTRSPMNKSEQEAVDALVQLASI